MDYNAGMLKEMFISLAVCFGVACAEPLSFYITPGEGITTWKAPLVRIDAAALDAAEQTAELAAKKYQQGLGTALDCAAAQLALVRLQRPLMWSEVSAKMQRLELFEAARKVRDIVEKLHENQFASDETLYKAQLDDAWMRVLSLAGGRALDVYQEKLKLAEALLGKLELLIADGVRAGQNDKADVLLVKAAQGEVKLASCSRSDDTRAVALLELQQTYDVLAELMTAREKQGLCAGDAAESAREAARVFRREVNLQSEDNSPGRVAALKEYCDIFESLIPLIQQKAECGTKQGRLLRYDAKYARHHLERLRQDYESACEKLQK